MADLFGLNLWRNDPEMAARLIAEAEQGDMDAQYAAGLIYASRFWEDYKTKGGPVISTGVVSKA